MHRLAAMPLVLLLALVWSTSAAGQQDRPYKMATTAVQMTPLTPIPYNNGNANFPLSEVAADVDMITLWPEYLGIPFDVFAQGPNISPDHPWAVKMLELAADVAATGKPVLLELGLVRTGMVSWARDVDGQLVIEDGWAGVCYDFTTAEAQIVADGFVNYTVWMVQTFAPDYLVNFIEANLYYHDCGGASASWDVIVSVQQRTYDAVKAVAPSLPVGPSIKIESLYGHQLNGWLEEEYLAISVLSRDFFGMSVYPFGQFMWDENRLASPYDLPIDYLVRVLLRNPEEKLVIAETGWNSASIHLGDTESCFPGFPYSEESWVRDYMGFVFGSARYGQFEFINWWSMRDAHLAESLSTCYVRDSLPFAACGGDPWCAVTNYIKDVTFEGNSELFSELVLKAFGSFGMKTYDGVERPMLMDRWRAERALPIVR